MRTTATTAVATPRKDMAAFFQSPTFMDAVRQALPKHCTPDRFQRMAIVALLRTPKLAECTRESLLEKMIQLASLGIEPDGRRAHLLPFGNQVQLIIDYKGIAELILRSGEVTKLHADVVCENDAFAYSMGEIQEHRIDFRLPRGASYAAYAVATMKNGAVACVVLGRDEIESIRKRSRSAQGGPWVTDWNEMAKKSAFRRLSKWLPLSPDLRGKVEIDDEDLDTTEMKTATVVAPNFLTDAPPYTAEATVEVPTGGTAVNPPPVEAPKQTRKPKAAPTPPPQEPAPIEVESTVTPEPPADIEPPPATVAAAPQSELEALLVANGASWAQVRKAASEMGWFGETKLTDSVDTLPQIQKDWLKKNVRGICKLAGKVVV